MISHDSRFPYRARHLVNKFAIGHSNTKAWVEIFEGQSVVKGEELFLSYGASHWDQYYSLYQRRPLKVLNLKGNLTTDGVMTKSMYKTYFRPYLDDNPFDREEKVLKIDDALHRFATTSKSEISIKFLTNREGRPRVPFHDGQVGFLARPLEVAHCVILFQISQEKRFLEGKVYDSTKLEEMGLIGNSQACIKFVQQQYTEMFANNLWAIVVIADRNAATESKRKNNLMKNRQVRKRRKKNKF